MKIVHPLDEADIVLNRDMPKEYEGIRLTLLRNRILQTNYPPPIRFGMGEIVAIWVVKPKLGSQLHRWFSEYEYNEKYSR